MLELGNFAWHLVTGPLVVAPLLGFAGAMFALLFVIQTVTIRRMRAEARRAVPAPEAGGFLFTGPAEFAPLQAGMISMAEFRERMAALPGFLPPPAAAPRSAWDVSLTLNPAFPWNDVCHYENASRKPDGIAAGVIRVIPRTAERPFWQVAGTPVITSWTIVTRAPSHGEGIDLLKAAEPLLRERLADLADARVRYFRLAGGELAEVPDMFGACAAETGERLAAPVPSVSMKDVELGFARLTATLGPCAHQGAEPVDLLVTGERVAWVCPKCGAELPADWR